MIELSISDLPTTLRNRTAQVLNEKTKVTLKNEGKGRFKIKSTMTTCDVNIFHFLGATVGDLNGDGSVNTADLEAIDLALRNEASYRAIYAGIDPDLVGDLNGSGTLDNADSALLRQSTNQTQ